MTINISFSYSFLLGSRITTNVVARILQIRYAKYNLPINTKSIKELKTKRILEFIIIFFSANSYDYIFSI